MNKILKHSAFLLFIVTFCYACKMYSFTGASIPAEAKTVSVGTFENKASLVEPTLAQLLTDALRDKFVSQTTLDLVDQEGDLQLEGDITAYRISPIAIQGDQTAAMNRLSITIRVKFTNLYDDTKDYEQSFTRYADYSSETDLASELTNLLEVINEALVEDVFNKAVVNW